MGVCADRWSYPAGWLGRAGCALRGVRGSSTRNTTYNSSRVQVWLRDTAVIEWPLSPVATHARKVAGTTDLVSGSQTRS